MTKQCDFGLIGLAVMGENLALNIDSRGLSAWRCSTAPPARSTTSSPARPPASDSSAATRVEELVAKLATAAQGHADGQGRPGRRRVHRAA